MNDLGPVGCREQFGELAAELREVAERFSWFCKCKAAACAVTSGLAFKLNPLDPIGSLLEEAIRRAEESTMDREDPERAEGV